MANTKITNHIVDKTFISGLTAVTPVAGDYVIIGDTSDSNNLKKALVSGLTDSDTSLLATDIKIGEDDETKIDFETADEIHFYAANAHQVKLVDGAIVPVTDNDIDLGTSSLEFKDLFLDGTAHVDTLDVDANATVAGTLGVTGAATLSGGFAAANKSTVIVPDGTGDDDWAFEVHNLEATDGRSYGMKIEAGSTANDQALVIQDHDGTKDLLVLDGASKLGIGTGTLNKIVNFADPAQGGETLKLHFEADSSADKWGIYAYDRTNSHYANMSLGQNGIYITGADNPPKIGIGTASPAYNMHIQKAATETTLAIQSNISPTGSSVGGRLRLQLGSMSNAGSGIADTSAGDKLGQVLFEGQGTDYSYQAGEVACVVTTGDGNDGRVNQGAALTFGTMSVGATSQVEKMRLTAKGDLCVGGTNEEHTSSDIGPSIHLMSDTYGTDVSLHLHPDTGEWSLYAYNGFLGIIDHTANTYRMKIASNGEVTFGTTNDYGAKLTALETRSDHTALLGEATDGSFTHNVIDASCTRNTANASYRLYQGQRRGTAVVFSVNDAGNVQNTNNSFTGLSDQRLKTNIADAGSQWDDIKALKVRTYQWGMGNTGHTQLGVISQEVEAAGMNGLVEESPADEYHIAYDSSLEGEKIKSVKYSVLYMKAVKALQEAMTKIEALEARVTTLEG